MTTSLTSYSAQNWFLIHRKPLLVVLVGSADTAIVSWMTAIREKVHCHFLVPAGLTGRLSGVDETYFTSCDFLTDARTTDLLDVKDWIQRFWRRCDVVLLDLENPLIDVLDVVRLEHAAYAYNEEHEVGIVSPAQRVRGETVAGFDFDRLIDEWVPIGLVDSNIGQNEIPRYSLTAPVHGLYITSDTIDRVSVSHHVFEGLGFGDQVSLYVAMAWRQNVRTLTFASVVLEATLLQTPLFTEFHADWLKNRPLIDIEGNLRIVFVLNATSVSGGIRTVFEQAMGLRARGFAVEIWSLEGHPTWTHLDIPVKQYRSYPDLLLALREVDAIKVATWWETGQIVWLSCVNHGVPANFVQEFETWFYPDDEEARAAVVASYRREFAYVTIADYQRAELKAIGVDAPVIPVGYSRELFNELADVERRGDTVLAVGRSFFQKNFAMTLAAWQSLGESRPRLELFGGEPDLVVDEKATYHMRPEDAEVNRLYNSATVFVQTSRHEGFCLPIIEAMAAGCPVITTDSHGNRGFCLDEENCIIVEHDDVSGLAAAIERVLGDPVLQDRLRRAGLETVKRLEWSVILDDLDRHYRALA